MENENKEAIDIASTKVEEEQESKELDQASKEALTAFILSLIALSLCPAWLFGGVSSIILSSISLSKCEEGKESTVQPYRTFAKIAYPVSIVALIFGIIVTVGYGISLFLYYVG